MSGGRAHPKFYYVDPPLFKQVVLIAVYIFYYQFQYIMFLLMCQVCSYKTDSVTNTLHTIIIQSNIIVFNLLSNAPTLLKESRRFNIILIKLLSFFLYVCLSVCIIHYVCVGVSLYHGRMNMHEHP